MIEEDKVIYIYIYIYMRFSKVYLCNNDKILIYIKLDKF